MQVHFLRSDANATGTGSYLFNRNNPAINNSSYGQGQNHIELRTTNSSNPILGFHRSGYTATALYHSGYGINSLRMRNADGNDGPIFSTFNDGAGSGLDADLLDGLHSSGYVRLASSGVKTAGTLNFNDNVILSFGTGNDAEFFCNGSHFYLDLNANIGNFYIRDGTSTRFTLDDSGDFIAAGDITAYSDITLKENIEVIPDAMEKLQTLHGITYTRKDHDKNTKYTGVIAQEVEKVLPEAVHTNEEGIKSVAYGNMVGLLIEAIKEQQNQIELLKNKLKS